MLSAASCTLWERRHANSGGMVALCVLRFFEVGIFFFVEVFTLLLKFTMFLEQSFFLAVYISLTIVFLLVCLVLTSDK